MKAYQDLLRYVLHNGERKENRTGVDTLSVFNYNYCLDFNELLEYNEKTKRYGLNGGFPLLTTKEISWKNIVIELLWFLSGSNNLEFLHRHGIKFWDAWAYQDGTIKANYGPCWRNFPCPNYPDYDKRNEESLAYFDQIYWIVNELKTNPFSRRMVVSAWSPGESQSIELPACHYSFVLNVQNENLIDKKLYVEEGFECRQQKKVLNLHLTQRSGDAAIGIPFNIASYCLLLQLFARFSGIMIGSFSHSIVDAHIYTSKSDKSMTEYDHVPGVIEQLIRDPKPLPKLIISDKIQSFEDLEKLWTDKLSTQEIMNHFILENYNSHPPIKFKVAV